MPGKKGTSRAPDGSYIATEDAKRQWAELDKKDPPKKKRKKVADEEPIRTQYASVLEPEKVTGSKNKDTLRYPRVTIVEFDDKGRARTMTFVCDPSSLIFQKQESMNYTTLGRAKKKIWFSLEGDVVEVA